MRKVDIRRGVVLCSMTPLLGVALLGCPTEPPEEETPLCEELACQSGAVCLDGACRPWSCAEISCEPGTVCQGGRLCVSESEAEEDTCETLECPDGFRCLEGPVCRPAREDLDADGATSAVDCDDGDARRYPGNPEICDGYDNDCNGATDDGAPCREGQRCCGLSGCIVVESNRENCGACGRECALYEECIEAQCQEAGPPVITAVEPDPLQTGVWYGRDEIDTFFIHGEKLLGYATVFIDSDNGISSADPFEVSSTGDGTAYGLDSPLMIDGAKLPGGGATLRVERNDGTSSEPFQITVAGAAEPVISAIAPNPIGLGEPVYVTVTGSGFWGAPVVVLYPDTAPEDGVELPTLWVTDVQIRCSEVTLDPVLYIAGTWSAVVRNPDETESAPYPIEVAPAPAPTLTRIVPDEAPLGAEVTLEVHGFDLLVTSTVTLAPEGAMDQTITLPLERGNPELLVTQPFTAAPPTFEAQRYFLWVVNPDEQESNPLMFVVY